MNKCFYCDERTTVSIDTGKVRGCFLNGVYYFRGIPYCTAERFMMPKPVEPWEGVRNAFTYGRVSPTITKPDCVGPMALAAEPLFGYRFRPEGENCQSINVWTKDISGKGKKKPVMVWVHGGGFAGGSSVEQMSYDPTNLCAGGDVVCVSFNHRLNILGFLDLSEYGEKYHNSGNAGIADIIEALKWVKRNIAVFGGDPDNITLHGQSGGGEKIKTLLHTPASYDLFNKCIIQSGLFPPHCPDDKKIVDGKKVADAVVKQLGLTKETIDDIKNFTFDELRDAYLAVEPQLKKEGVSLFWSPTPNDFYLGSLLTMEFTEKAKTTPMMVGCTAAEWCLNFPDFIPYSIPEERKLELLKAKFGDSFDKVYAEFRRTYPDKDLMHLFYMDFSIRTTMLDFADRRRKAGYPIYNYLLDYDFKFCGTTPSYHGAELPLVFNSTDSVDAFNEPDLQALGVKVSSAWAHFAYYGNPNTTDFADWLPYDETGGHTMVFSNTCELKTDFDRDLLELMRSETKPLV